MPEEQEQQAAFDRFVARRKKDLRRIASHTRGEHEFSDVVSEAWLLSQTMSLAAAEGFDLDQPSAQQRLLSHLYQHLVRYTELNVRHAVRLDHAVPGGEDDDCHPLMRALVSDDGRDPLAELIARDDATLHDGHVDGHGSLAAAYVLLLRRFDNRMRDVAAHLLISESWAYQRCARARELAIWQRSVPTCSRDERFVPGPWRAYRLRRTPMQLAFDFDEELPLQIDAETHSNVSEESPGTAQPHSHSIVAGGLLDTS